MINILSVRTSLAFAPYLNASIASFLEGGQPARSIRQGGNGLIIRTAAADGLVVVHQNRTSTLAGEDLTHYLATIDFRTECYDIARTSDEIVLATVNDLLLLSHPQSEIWLNADDVSLLVARFHGRAAPSSGSYSKPEWLNTSSGGGRLLISDQRTGRWVLLAEDHIAEMERRLPNLRQRARDSSGARPPTIGVKGVTVHLQSAFGVAQALQDFVDDGVAASFSEQAPGFRLAVSPCAEGIELRDADARVALTRKECSKWSEIVLDELRALNATQTERGNIRTVFADAEDGRWVLQWGDEVLAPSVSAWRQSDPGPSPSGLCFKNLRGYLLVLSLTEGHCVALAKNELEHLTSKSEKPA